MYQRERETYMYDAGEKKTPSKLCHTKEKTASKQISSLSAKKWPITSEKLSPTPVFSVEYENQH